MLNVLEGADGEVEIQRAQNENDQALELSCITESNKKEVAQNTASEQKNISDNDDNNFPLDESEAATPNLEGIPLSKLQNIDSSQLPRGVDPTKRELALSEKEFEEVFGMNMEAFNQLAAWKRNNLKKKHGLF